MILSFLLLALFFICVPKAKRCPCKFTSTMYFSCAFLLSILSVYAVSFIVFLFRAADFSVEFVVFKPVSSRICTWVFSRETLKASADEVHAALRDAKLRVGQALSSGDAAKRDAEAARAEVLTLCPSVVSCVCRVCGRWWCEIVFFLWVLCVERLCILRLRDVVTLSNVCCFFCFASRPADYSCL